LVSPIGINGEDHYQVVEEPLASRTVLFDDVLDVTQNLVLDMEKHVSKYFEKLTKAVDQIIELGIAIHFSLQLIY
jgi:hypothetical protein